MKICQAAALALVGWYLVVPPLPQQESGEDAKPPESGAPLPQWSKAGPFETSEECVEAKDKLLMRAKKGLEALRKELDAVPPSASELPLSQADRKVYDDEVTATVFAAASFQAQCIATDDPRLKGK